MIPDSLSFFAIPKIYHFEHSSKFLENLSALAHTALGLYKEKLIAVSSCSGIRTVSFTGQRAAAV